MNLKKSLQLLALLQVLEVHVAPGHLLEQAKDAWSTVIEKPDRGVLLGGFAGNLPDRLDEVLDVPIVIADDDEHCGCLHRAGQNLMMRQVVRNQ